jgi:protein gp37
MNQELIVLNSRAMDELRHIEERMERNMRNAFYEFGLDLAYIAEKTLYNNAGYTTFADYASQRWEVSEPRAYQLINAAKAVKQLYTIVEKNSTNVNFVEELPAREAHVRPLLQLDSPEDRLTVWRMAQEGSNGHGVTAKDVEAAVAQFQAAKAKNWITLTEWESGRRWHGGPSRNGMNETNDNIEWAAWSWNPITGCLHNCDYCYARDIANRFYAQKFEPSFIPERLTMPDNTKPAAGPRYPGDIGYNKVFTCSMADLFGKWVPEEWITSVLEAIARNPQWTFLLLSKFPVRMADFEYPPNVWLGTTVDRQYAVHRAETAFTKIKTSGFSGVCWLSCEPMLERLTFGSLDMFDWVVMGGSSKSTQTPEYRPPFDDIVHLHNQARAAGCRVYQKTNLIPGMSDEQRIREYPAQEAS